MDHPHRARSIRSLLLAHGLAAQIEGRALLTRTGDGHTSIYTSDCARSAAEKFLTERHAEANQVCPG